MLSRTIKYFNGKANFTLYKTNLDDALDWVKTIGIVDLKYDPRTDTFVVNAANGKTYTIEHAWN